MLGSGYIIMKPLINQHTNPENGYNVFVLGYETDPKCDFNDLEMTKISEKTTINDKISLN